MLDRKNQSLKDIMATLQKQHDSVNEDKRALEDSEDQAPSQREILRGLIAYLDGC
jgi:beta-catenin-like protein 1